MAGEYFITTKYAILCCFVSIGVSLIMTSEPNIPWRHVYTKLWYPPPSSSPPPKNSIQHIVSIFCLPIVHKISGVDPKYKEIDGTQLKFWSFFVRHADSLSIGWEY